MELNLAKLGLATVTEDGVRFETGRPVTFKYVRNTEKAGHFGARYGQDIEPHGLYVLHANPATLPSGWIRGTLTFRRPLVMHLTLGGEIYGPNGWKARLVAATKKKKAALSSRLRELGYDGIVTVSGGGTSEIVKLPDAYGR